MKQTLEFDQGIFQGYISTRKEADSEVEVRDLKVEFDVLDIVIIDNKFAEITTKDLTSFTVPLKSHEVRVR